MVDYNIDGPKSLHQRLILAGHPSHLLNVQYRMHPEILSISNELFYQKQIQNGYVYRETNKFLDKNHPVLIIDVKGEEYRHGTSIQNQAEAEIVS
jgi:superfamily I DNA and/or RNA helicase